MRYPYKGLRKNGALAREEGVTPIVERMIILGTGEVLGISQRKLRRHCVTRLFGDITNPFVG